MSSKKKGLGRGLDALLSEWGSPTEELAAEVTMVGVDEIKPCAVQPRTRVSEESLLELAESIRHKGIIQPVLVRKKSDHFELIAGERRWRAAGRAGLARIPAIVRELPDAEVLEIALIENIQREDLNPVEEARAYQTLMDDHGLTQQELADRLGKNRSTVANMLRLNQLPDEVKEHLFEGRLSMGHARALLGLDEAERIVELAERVVAERLSVRETEKAVAAKPRVERPRRQVPEDEQAYFADLEREMSGVLGMKVNIRNRGTSGSIKIDYGSHEELSRLLDLIKAQ